MTTLNTSKVHEIVQAYVAEALNKTGKNLTDGLFATAKTLTDKIGQSKTDSVAEAATNIQTAISNLTSYLQSASFEGDVKVLHLDGNSGIVNEASILAAVMEQGIKKGVFTVLVFTDTVIDATTNVAVPRTLPANIQGKSRTVSAGDVFVFEAAADGDTNAVLKAFGDNPTADTISALLAFVKSVETAIYLEVTQEIDAVKMLLTESENLLKGKINTVEGSVNTAKSDLTQLINEKISDVKLAYQKAISDLRLFVEQYHSENNQRVGNVEANQAQMVADMGDLKVITTDLQTKVADFMLNR